MTLYRHALWPPCAAWRFGYLYGAPVAEFRAAFPAKVRELGAPLMVWDAESAPGNDLI